jgi:hypothetical protein
MPNQDEPPVDLDSLTRWVRGRTRRCTELDRLSLAVKVGVHLDRMSDELVGQFVEEARQAGVPWSQIGERLGVTKQAAQQRHVGRRGLFGPRRSRPPRSGGLFVAFTERARQSIEEAQNAARDLGHNYLGTEHILLGVLLVRGSLGSRALETLGVSAASVRDQVLAEIGRGSGQGSGHIPFTPRAKKTLQLAKREAARLHADQIGTEHLILGLLREGQGVAVQALRALGAEPAAIRQEIERRVN